MICCKCGRTIDKTYGRITDLGNYCKACAYQNENEVNQIVQSAIEKVKIKAVKEFAEKVKDYINDKVVEEFYDMAVDVQYITIDIDEFEEYVDELLKEYEK